jgi:hypothetical protein
VFHQVALHGHREEVVDQRLGVSTSPPLSETAKLGGSNSACCEKEKTG